VRWVRGHPALTAASAGVTAAAVVAVLAVIASGAPAAPPSPSTPPSPVVSPTTSARAAAPSPLTGPDGPVLPVAARLADLAGRTVRAHGVRVLAVPADEGFWVGEGPGRRVWVQLRSNGESWVTVRPGQRLTFTGRVVRDDADFVRRAGVTDTEGAGELARQGAHVEVDPDDLVAPTEPVPS
jgi:hypothetical protein